MKRLLLLCLLWIPLFSDLQKPPTIRVLLTKLANSATIKLQGHVKILDLKSEEVLQTHKSKSQLKVLPLENGLSIGKPLPDVSEVQLLPASPSSKIFVNGVQYKGAIEIYSIGGTLNIVNEVDTENYLKSILSQSLNSDLSDSALDAAVITERTNLYHLLENAPYASWHVEGRQVGYRGIVSQKKPTPRAVERTRDLLLLYKKKPFATACSWNHAGKSANYSSIFRKNTLAPSAVKNLPSIHFREKSKWSYLITTKKLAQITSLPSVDEVDLFQEKSSNKVYAIRVRFQDTHKDIDFFTLQQTLGKQNLLSNDFTVKHMQDKIVFTGFGMGNGVGLCLQGSQLLSSQGSSAEKILAIHFPGSELINIHQEMGLDHVDPIWK